MASGNPNLLGLAAEELEGLAESLGRPRYHGRQLFRAIYSRRERNLLRLTELDRKFRELLSSHYQLTYPAIVQKFVSRDGAVRYLLSLEDRKSVETVYMAEEDRVTLCLSSQVGCAVDCRFCFTALLGLQRNLTAGEIVGQVLAVAEAQQILRGTRLNLVLMGMGEPLLNLPQVMKAVRILADPQGMAIPLRRITLSTCGITPRIAELARQPLRPKLAVSLNASHEAQRSELMPINRKYPLEELLRVCRAYPLRPRERLTFEYVLLEGINDSDADALRIADLLHGMRAKVNLIPYNGGPELPYRPPPFERVLAFQHILTDRHLPAFIRISRGQDVRAACGQLCLDGRDSGLGIRG
jgi:23S rRNA (adenine2503-C2)-methyltransferase